MHPTYLALRRIAQFATRQHGLVSREQARRCGLSDRQIDLRLRTGQLVTHRPGILGMAGVPPSWEQTVHGAVLAAAPDGMACGPTAARLWPLHPCPPADSVHILTPSSARRTRRVGIVGHRSALVVAGDRSHRHGMAVTSPARTIVDCAGLLGPDRTGSALDDALRRSLVSLETVRQTAARLAVPGRKHRTVMAAVLSARLPGYDPGDSDLEVQALTRIHRAGLDVPVQQHPVDAGGRRLHIDLAYPSLMIGIELDGWEWHRHRTSFDRDRRRISWLTTAGWAMLVPTSATIDDLVPQLEILIPARRSAIRPSA